MGLLKRRSDLRICAVIAVRNEHAYLQHLLPRLHGEGIDVVIVDNDSSDETASLLSEYSDAPVVDVVRQPWTGHFSLSEQLAVKDRVMANLGHDWVVHQDADEVLTGRDGSTLRSVIEDADRQRYNVVNFDEFVFLPTDRDAVDGVDYVADFDRYYFFAPQPVRLNRAWKRTAAKLSPDHGGHLVTGRRTRMNPVHHDLRHYIALSVSHLNDKYATRVFSSAEVDRGWHANRVGLHGATLTVDTGHRNLSTASGALGGLSRDNPVADHFWDWS